MHEVAVLVMDRVVPFDFAMPVDAFNWTGRYRVRVCGPKRTVVNEFFTLKVPHGLELLSEVDTIVLAGHDPDLVVPRKVIEALRQAAARAPGSRRSARGRSCSRRPGCWTGCG